ncbi:MAG: hypothetical protein GYB33_20065 [Gammaproteobacteria bacterium]|uniref:hypothetical protein n=1 Tax=Pseudomaricurvus alcaniphilus TaxID=1166482 RepID=UPI00140B1912|nr:hypothetical protein [Pseudomaricurvus alcaniphilus]MBR9912644.1 hypothetical protein [Gammaproteobacteria bacterium]NHN35997.1 hypothetical protein [Pseudomaricurvus alcaniphilus]
MDQESIVYGCIKDSALPGHESLRRRRNREAMLTLPSADDWPFLCQEMFAIPPLQVNQNHYQTDVMHFGASYKAVEYEWEQWIEKFEQLLNQMYWHSAVVHLETELSGHHTFSWESSGSFHQPGSGDLQVRCEWSHDGALRL